MYDLHNEVKITRLISPAAIINGNGTTTSEILDTSGYDTCEIIVFPGAVTDGTWTCTLYEDTAAGMGTEGAVSSADLLGSAPSIDSTDANTPNKFGYIGNKRYLRLKAAQVGAGVGGYLSAFAIQTRAKIKPVA